MISSDDLCLLQWRCACIYVSRKRKGYALSRGDLKVLQEMRRYLRDDERPPQALINRASSLFCEWQARRKGLVQKPKNSGGRIAQLKAARARQAAAERTARAARISAWRTELHQDAFDLSAEEPLAIDPLQHSVVECCKS